MVDISESWSKSAGGKFLELFICVQDLNLLVTIMKLI